MFDNNNHAKKYFFGVCTCRNPEVDTLTPICKSCGGRIPYRILEEDKGDEDHELERIKIPWSWWEVIGIILYFLLILLLVLHWVLKE